MITVTYSVFSEVLNKEFINSKEVKTIQDFELFALSLNLNYQIITVK
tara:strand:+ start:1062 stop:1202 length:141 start_codon:yes stop_codon:yes gene_type:complete